MMPAITHEQAVRTFHEFEEFHPFWDWDNRPIAKWALSPTISEFGAWNDAYANEFLQATKASILSFEHRWYFTHDGRHGAILWNDLFVRAEHRELIGRPWSYLDITARSAG